MLITTPYNFVPLNDKIYIPGWWKQVNQDVPFSDGEDGIIEVYITNISPLFVRNGTADRINKEEFSSHIIDEKGNRHYFIPGTSIKGAIRSNMEVLSFAKLDKYNKDSFGYRDITLTEYHNKISDRVKCGWLEKDNNGKYQLTPCGKPIKVHHELIKTKIPTFYKGQNNQTAECKQLSVKQNEELYPIVDWCEYDLPDDKYRLVCTGYMNSKLHEYIFSENRGECIELSDDLMKTFNKVHEHSSYYSKSAGNSGFLKKRLEERKEIPVFYLTDEDGNIESMGLTYNYKLPYKNNVESCIHQDKTEGDDLPSTIFGHISSNSSKGRVQVGNAFCEKLIKDEECIKVSGVLGEPRASFYPFYLKQNGPKLRNYNAVNPEIAGRKHYRIHKGSTVSALPKGNGNEKTTSNFRPIPRGNTFKCRISVHNLKPAEIGAIISSLTFNETSGTYLNLGLAKSFGYGKVTCDVSLNMLQNDKNYYLIEFEKEICKFCKENDLTFSNNESIQTLMAIHSEHADNIEMMELQQYTSIKDPRKKIFPNLHEKREITMHLDECEILTEKEIKAKEQEEEVKRQQVERILLDLKPFDKLLTDDKIQDAENLLASVQTKLNKNKIETELIDVYKKKLSDKRDENRKLLEQKELEKQQVPLKERLEDVKSLGTTFGKIKKWYSDNLQPTLDADTILLIVEHIKKVSGGIYKYDGKDWKVLRKSLGDETAKIIYDRIIESK